MRRLPRGHLIARLIIWGWCGIILLSIAVTAQLYAAMGVEQALVPAQTTSFPSVSATSRSRTTTVISPTPTIQRILPIFTAQTSTPPPAPPLVTDTEALYHELLLLRADVSRLWSAYHLARASSQLADAEAALRINDLNEVERVLVTVGISLDQAYERSLEQDKGPISAFRAEVGQMHEELRRRPDNIDLQLRRLRQSMLNLVDEPPQ